MAENHDDATDGVHGHDAGQEEAQVAVVNPQGIPYISVVHKYLFRLVIKKVGGEKNRSLRGCVTSGG